MNRSVNHENGLLHSIIGYWYCLLPTVVPLWIQVMRKLEGESGALRRWRGVALYQKRGGELNEAQGGEAADVSYDLQFEMNPDD